MKRKLTIVESADHEQPLEAYIVHNVSIVPQDENQRNMRRAHEKCSDPNIIDQLLDENGFMGLRWFRKEKKTSTATKTTTTTNDSNCVNICPGSKPVHAERSHTLTLQDLCREDVEYGNECQDSTGNGKVFEEELLDMDAFFAKEEEKRAIVEVTTPKPVVTESGVVNVDSSRFQKNLRKEVKTLRDKMGNGFRIICRQVAESGGREYAIVWMPMFVDKMLSCTKARDRTFNELVEEEEPCRLHMDLEIKIEPSKRVLDHVGDDKNPPSEDAIKLKDKVQRVRISRWLSACSKLSRSLRDMCLFLCKRLVVVFGLAACANSYCYNSKNNTYKHTNQCLDESQISWTVTDASTPEKISKHVVFVIHQDSVLFKNKRHVGYFVQHGINKWVESVERADGNNHFGALQSKGTKAAKVVSIKNEVPSCGVPQETMEEYSSWNIDAHPDGSTSWNNSQIANIVLKNMDMCVYQGEREFRMLESTKFGQKRPLILDDVCSVSSRHSDFLKLSVEQLREKPSQFASSYNYCMFRYCAARKGAFRQRLGTIFINRVGQLPADPMTMVDGDSVEEEEMESSGSTIHYNDDDDDDGSNEGDRDMMHAEGEDKLTTPFGEPPNKEMCPISDVTNDWERKNMLELFSLSTEETRILAHPNPVDIANVFYNTLLVPFHLVDDEPTLAPNGIAHYNSPPHPKEVQLLCFINKVDEMNRTKDSLLIRRADILRKMKVHAIADGSGRNGGCNPRKLRECPSAKSPHGKRLSMMESVPIYYSMRPYYSQPTNGRPSRLIGFKSELEDEEKGALGNVGGDSNPKHISANHMVTAFGLDQGADVTVLDTDEDVHPLVIMQQNEDDPLGMKIISDVAANIERETGMTEAGFLLTYKKEFVTDGLHYLMFATHHDYKICYLKGMRCGMHDNRHKSNNVYFMVRLNDNSYYQKCHNVDCRSFYAQNMVGLDPKRDKNAFIDCTKKAKGPIRKLQQKLWNRTANFMALHGALEAWDNKQQDIESRAKM